MGPHFGREKLSRDEGIGGLGFDNPCRRDDLQIVPTNNQRSLDFLLTTAPSDI